MKKERKEKRHTSEMWGWGNRGGGCTCSPDYSREVLSWCPSIQLYRVGSSDVSLGTVAVCSPPRSCAAVAADSGQSAVPATITCREGWGSAAKPRCVGGPCSSLPSPAPFPRPSGAVLPPPSPADGAPPPLSPACPGSRPGSSVPSFPPLPRVAPPLVSQVTRIPFPFSTSSPYHAWRLPLASRLAPRLKIHPALGCRIAVPASCRHTGVCVRMVCVCVGVGCVGWWGGGVCVCVWGGGGGGGGPAVAAVALARRAGDRRERTTGLGGRGFICRLLCPAEHVHLQACF